MRNNDSDRLQGFFTPHRRFSNKLPSLYLDSRHDPDNPYQLEVYFVNNSGFVLEWIELPSPLLYEYKNNLELSKQYHAIEPNEAVLVAQFDVVVDSDFLHQLIIVWKAHNQSLKEVRMIGKGIPSFATKYWSGFLMGSEGIVEFRATDPESHWQVFEFRFDRTARSASIFNFDTGSQIMKLPRQNRVTEGFPMHEGSSFSEELSVYLRYLYIHHLIVYFETPEVVHISDIDDCEADDCWDEDEGAFTYDTLNIRMPVDGHNKPCAGFSFIDDSLYSSIYLEVTEVD